MEYESFVCIPIPMGRADSGSLILFPTTIEPISQLSSWNEISSLLKCIISPD